MLLAPIALVTAELVKYVAYVSGGYGSFEGSRTSYTSKSPVRVQVGVVLALGDDFVVSVVHAEVEICLVADDGISPAVVDTKSHKIDLFALHGALVNGGILLLKIVCELWAIVTSI